MVCPNRVNKTAHWDANAGNAKVNAIAAHVKYAQSELGAMREAALAVAQVLLICAPAVHA